MNIISNKRKGTYTEWQDSSIGNTKNAPTLSYQNYFFSGNDITVGIIPYYKNKIIHIPVTDMVYGVSQEKIPIYSAFSYCVDEKTEALTQRGWVSGRDLDTNDIILSMNQDGGLVWSKINDIYRNEGFNGKMHKITGSGIDALVTEGHRFVTFEDGLVRVEDLRNKHRICIMGKSVEKNSSIYSDDFIELVGWFVTEGYIKSTAKKAGINNKRAITITQSEKVNPEKVKCIRSCLINLNVSFSEYKDNRTNVIHFYIGATNNIVSELQSVAPGKVLDTSFITKLSTKQVEILINTMLDGDGTKSSTPWKTVQYIQKDKLHIDSFQMLCSIGGIPTTYSYSTTSGCYVVTLKSRKVAVVESLNFYEEKRNSHSKNHIPTENYCGLVWCPNTDYGTFVCRRNSKVYVTGNTWDVVAKGTKIVRGEFSIVFSKPNYIGRLLGAPEDADTPIIDGTAVNPIVDVSTEELVDNKDSLREQFWGSANESITTSNVYQTSTDISRPAFPFGRQPWGKNWPEGKYEADYAGHQPFDLIIIMGTTTSYHRQNNDGFNGYTSWIEGMDDEENPYSANQYNDEYHVRSEKIILKNVEIMSCGIGIDPSGQPLRESYSFLARDAIIGV